MVGARRGATPPAVAASVLLLAGAIALACGGGDGGDRAPEVSSTPVAPEDGRLTVRAFEWGFEPEAIALAEGEQVEIVLENEGRILHNLKVDDLSADVTRSESTGPLSGGEGEVFVGADAGASGVLAFSPREAGTLAFYCTIPQHRQLGMEGVLVVESAP